MLAIHPDAANDLLEAGFASPAMFTKDSLAAAVAYSEKETGEPLTVVSPRALEQLKEEFPQQPHAEIPKDKVPDLSRREIGKLRRQYITVQYPRVQPCGHRINLEVGPRTKCDICWFAWFNSKGEMVQGLDELFTKHGEAGFIQVHGRKFFKRFILFMATMAKVKETMEKNQRTEQFPPPIQGSDAAATA